MNVLDITQWFGTIAFGIAFLYQLRSIKKAYMEKPQDRTYLGVLLIWLMVSGILFMEFLGKISIILVFGQ